MSKKFIQIFLIFEFYEKFWKIENYKKKSENLWERDQESSKNITKRNFKKYGKQVL